jgi:hypothetical protein
MQVSQLVAQRFPGVEVIGSSYPLPVFNQAAATAVAAGRNVALAVALAGDQIFGFFNMPTPPWYTTNIVPNRMGWCLGKESVLCLSVGRMYSLKYKVTYVFCLES